MGQAPIVPTNAHLAALPAADFEYIGVSIAFLKFKWARLS